MEDLERFMKTGREGSGKQERSEVTQNELEEVAFRAALEELDQKIERIEAEVHSKAVADGSFVPTYHPKYGQKITE